MRRRIDGEPDHVAQLLHELRIVRELELPDPVWLQAVGAPDPLDRTDWTELTLMPTAFAIIAPVQWVASACGAVRVSATTRSATSAPSGRMRDGRVLSRRRPSTPSAMNRSCQRQTQGLDLPVRRMISTVPTPSAVAKMIPARQTCFCGLFRSATTASNRVRSAALTSTVMPLRIHRDSHSVKAMGSFR